MISFSRCKNEELVISACGLDNPTENIPWLENLIKSIYSEESRDLTSIDLYTFNSEEIILVTWRNIGIADVPTGSIFNCNGELLYSCGGNQPIDSCTYVINKSKYIRLLEE